MESLVGIIESAQWSVASIPDESERTVEFALEDRVIFCNPRLIGGSMEEFWAREAILNAIAVQGLFDAQGFLPEISILTRMLFPGWDFLFKPEEEYIVYTHDSGRNVAIAADGDKTENSMNDGYTYRRNSYQSRILQSGLLAVDSQILRIVSRRSFSDEPFDYHASGGITSTVVISLAFVGARTGEILTIEETDHFPILHEVVLNGKKRPASYTTFRFEETGGLIKMHIEPQPLPNWVNQIDANGYLHRTPLNKDVWPHLDCGEPKFQGAHIFVGELDDYWNYVRDSWVETTPRWVNIYGTAESQDELKAYYNMRGI